ncbi:hypothetical protein WUBG_13449 [Wuchereria bancrofti]|uniref:Phosphoglycerate mutase n=1 Tax=Wuchereria bancrofti TaxID=6293 RepID=J9AMZ4_WUCBA|nr:hypothetical protein WUBG_13449 [Wuchereria bancrofti]
MLPCRLVVMRHGERIDDLFPEWIHKSTSSGLYQAFDLNMPLTLPELKRPFKHYEDDTIISEMGFVLAEMVGRGLLINKSIPDIIYASPALRCVQTAHSVLKGMGKKTKLKFVLNQHFLNLLNFIQMENQNLQHLKNFTMLKFNIDINYVPFETNGKCKKLIEF